MRRAVQSLTVKIGSAFLFVSIAGIVVAAIFSRIITQQTFNQVFTDRNKAAFVTTVQSYYAAHGSWDGVGAYMRSLAGQPPANADNPTVQMQPQPFLLTDASYVILLSDRLLPPGATLPADQRQNGQAVVVSGTTVGWVFVGQQPQNLSPQEQAYINRTDVTLLLSSLVAVLVALMLGLLFARSLTRPVRDLTQAITTMTQGSTYQAVPVRSADELGELSRAFNEMGARLAEATRQRQQLTADIAHDLRTPLTVITGYLEALRDGVLPPSPDRFEMLYTEAHHLQHLIDDLRTLSLADAGELTLQREAVNPVELLQQISARYQLQADQQAIHLVVEVVGDLPVVQLDGARMVQVFNNLVSNALRYTPAGGTITLTASREDGDLVCMVRDTGSGIDAAALPYIFDRFYRAESARTRNEGESGLGLAIVRAIVVAHGGTVDVSSQTGQGTVFTLRIPLQVQVELPDGRG